MAQRVQVLLVDDVDGSTADETVLFGLDGVTYEIDLTAAHAAELREVFASWVGHARRTGGRASSSRSGSRRSRSAGPGSAADVRVWAKSQGLEVPERGRIPAAVRDAYDKAH